MRESTDILQLAPRRRLWLAALAPALLMGAVAGYLVAIVGRPGAGAWPAPPPPGTVRFALCQYPVVPADTDATRERVLRLARRAFRDGATYVLLPELSFHGLRDVPRAGNLAESINDSPLLDALSRLAREYRGYILANLLTRVEDQAFNTSVLLGPQGRLKHTHHKSVLAHVDRAGGLARGDTFDVVETPHGRLAILICREADQWLTDLKRWGERPESLPPDDGRRLLWESEPELREAHLVILQLAYAGMPHVRHRDPNVGVRLWDGPRVLVGLAYGWAQRIGAHVLLINQTGRERGYFYAGHSLAVTPAGQLIAMAGYEPRLVYVDLALDADGKLVRDADTPPATPFQGWPLAMPGDPPALNY